MVQFQNEFVVVELVNNATAIVLTWKGYIPSAIYRESLEKSLDIAKEHKITNWISDIRHMKMLEAQDQAWAISVWLPKAVSAGCYKKQAVLMPEDIFGGASARNLISAALGHLVDIQSFTTMEDAKEWVHSAGD